ncbi:hypothetical protein L6164_036554 [Bauhinia variegata]|uniref:Uncharacterized protein n=1 Tax=Bauhinia variegata TaxID=167791 RepID=A0ACB9KHD5_BAUVA|nr:hypothetical protein L6164_036554 [Bauhinia variegata]
MSHQSREYNSVTTAVTEGSGSRRNTCHGGFCPLDKGHKKRVSFSGNGSSNSEVCVSSQREESLRKVMYLSCWTQG